MKQFILENFGRDPISGALQNSELLKVNITKWLGHCLALSPFEAHVRLDFTSPPGGSLGIYYSLMFQLKKWEYQLEKSDEWVEVSPAHAQYYQLTQKQKEELEGRIKQGLASAAQAVADLELLMHDERKYREFLEYFGYRTYKELGTHGEEDEINFSEPAEKTAKRRDEHSLKAVFIDQVDAHIGENIAMRNIVSRWPTLITDFMQLTDKDIEMNDVKKKLDISKAEAVVLITKNKLYQEWKKLFGGQIQSRYKRIRELIRSRRASVNEYREWLKPVVARHKMLEEGLARPEFREANRTLFINPVGTGVSLSTIVIWTWKDFASPEFYKTGSDIVFKKPVNPYDEWTKRNLIFHPEQGLIVKYPWITEEWIKNQIANFYPPQRRWMLKHRHYYSFFIITLQRATIRSPDGSELDNGVFDVTGIFMSQNAMLVKLLELRARQEEFNRYIDTLIGITPKEYGPPTRLKPEKKYSLLAQKFSNYFSMPFQFFKRGPYERDFDDRITKYYLAPMAGERYGAIVGFIKRKMGMGVK